eukprot:g46061.t1
MGSGCPGRFRVSVRRWREDGGTCPGEVEKVIKLCLALLGVPLKHGDHTIPGGDLRAGWHGWTTLAVLGDLLSPYNKGLVPSGEGYSTFANQAQFRLLIAEVDEKKIFLKLLMLQYSSQSAIKIRDIFCFLWKAIPVQPLIEALVFCFFLDLYDPLRVVKSQSHCCVSGVTFVHSEILAFMLMGSLMVTAGLLSLLLPETRDKPLPETIQQMQPMS